MDLAHSDGDQSVAATSLLLRATEWLQPWYQKTILVDVFRHPLVYHVGYLVVGGALLAYGIWSRQPKQSTPPPEPVPRTQEETEDDLALNEFVCKKGESYEIQERLNDLGSRMKKQWWKMNKKQRVHDQQENSELDKEVLATVVPVSQSCPLILHDHLRHLNNLLEVIRMHRHPFIHPILEVYDSDNLQRLVIIQPFMKEGSLKDLIYKIGEPSLEWSEKYAHRSEGLPPHQVARYGRQILEAMRFLYGLGFPVLGHVQTGNIFVVNDVCRLGGYENTLLGYKTRLYRLCKDHAGQLDVILFGHLIFEMSAGYELTQLRPGVAELQTVPSSIRSILEFIFTDGFPHSVDEIAEHEFFDVALPELEGYDLTSLLEGIKKGPKDSMKIVLEKVHKNKPRVQKVPRTEGAGIKVRMWKGWKNVKQFFKGKRDENSDRSVADQASSSRQDVDETYSE